MGDNNRGRRYGRQMITVGGDMGDNNACGRRYKGNQ